MKVLCLFIYCCLCIPLMAYAEPSRLTIVNNILLELQSDIEMREGGICIFKENAKPFPRHVMLDCETLLGNIFLSDKHLPLNVSGKVVDDLISYGNFLIKSLYSEDLVLKVEKEEDATIFAKLFIYLKVLDNLHPNLGINLKVRTFYRENYRNIAPVFDVLKDEQSISKLIKIFIEDWEEDYKAEEPEFLSVYFKWYVQISPDDSLLSLFERFSFSPPDEILIQLRNSYLQNRDLLKQTSFTSQVIELPIECVEGGLVGRGSDCNFLDQLPKEMQDKIIKAYLVKFNMLIESSIDIRGLLSIGVLPDFISKSDLYKRYATEVLYPTLVEKKLLTEALRVRLHLDTDVPVEETKSEGGKKQSSNVLTILLSLGVLIAIFVPVGFMFITRRVGESSIGMSKEERAELRELKGFFGVTTFASIRDLSKSYRLKVREVHPDSGQVDTGTFLDLQSKYARVKELQGRFLGEKR